MNDFIQNWTVSYGANRITSHAGSKSFLEHIECLNGGVCFNHQYSVPSGARLRGKASRAMLSVTVPQFCFPLANHKGIYSSWSYIDLLLYTTKLTQFYAKIIINVIIGQIRFDTIVENQNNLANSLHFWEGGEIYSKNRNNPI